MIRTPILRGAASFLCSLALASPAYAQAGQGLVWSLDGSASASYLVGITHMSQDADARAGLPVRMREALKKAQSVYFETNMLPLTEHGRIDVQQWIQEIPARYPLAELPVIGADSPSLANANQRLQAQIASGRIRNPALPIDVVRRLDQEVDRLMPTQDRSQLVKNALASSSDAWLLWEIPSVLSSKARAERAKGTSGDKFGPGLDALLMSAAVNANKKVGRLESYQATMGILSDMLRRPPGLNANLMNLIDESLAADPDRTVAAVVGPVYAGDLQALRAGIEQQLTASAVFRNVFYPSMAYRNAAWAPVIAELMKSPACPCVFAVGAAHLVGERSLPEELARVGVPSTYLKEAQP